MSARSTGGAAVTVTVPVARSTVTESTPSTPEISSVTARWQCAHVMPVTVKVVEPMKVRGVLDSIGTPRKCWCWCGQERASVRGWGALTGEIAGISAEIDSGTHHPGPQRVKEERWLPLRRGRRRCRGRSARRRRLRGRHAPGGYGQPDHPGQVEDVAGDDGQRLGGGQALGADDPPLHQVAEAGQG